MIVDPIYIILIFIVVGIASSTFISFAVKKTRLKHQELENFIHSKSWLVEDLEGEKYKGSIRKIHDPKDNWVVLSYFNSSTISATGSANTVQWTEWRCEAGALEKGAVFLGPKLPAETIDKLHQRAAAPLTNIIKSQLFEFTPNLEIDLEDCKFVKPKAPNVSDAILATPGNENMVDLLIDLPALLEAREGRNEMQQPIIYRDIHGIKVRLRKSLGNTKDLDDIVTLGLAIRDALNQTKAF